MNNKEHFDLLKKAGMDVDPCERVRSLVTMLLDALSKPDLKHVATFDRERAISLGVDVTEPVNWAALHVIEVVPFDGCYLVDIEEAAPDQCPVLCAYIEKYMRSWGWEVNVKTEW